MKPICLFFFYALFLVRIEAQTPGAAVRPCLDSVLNFAQQHALKRNEVNWDSVRSLVYAKAAGAQNTSELGPAFSALLGALGDDHGRVLYQNNTIGFWYGELKENQKTIDPNMWSAVQSGLYPARAVLLSDSVGYLRLPGLSTGDNLQMAAEIRWHVNRLIDQGARCWIIDLRGNGGGNIFPMLEGIGPLLGDGPIGSHRDPVERSEFPWSIRDGNFFYGEYEAVHLPNTMNVPKNARVAVLTSRYTASSGEMVAICFKTRPNTRFFGEKTGGMITITNWVQPCEDLTLTLAAAYCADRTGRIYREYVDVDETVPFLITEEPNDDPAIKQALSWLKQRGN
ncbi:MAG TPA: S41 family peptidase [Saprospiraceae bacterium]|nr:S41 family peptidase [Saprospiraceae bacterium]